MTVLPNTVGDEAEFLEALSFCRDYNCLYVQGGSPHIGLHRLAEWL